MVVAFVEGVSGYAAFTGLAFAVEDDVDADEGLLTGGLRPYCVVEVVDAAAAFGAN